ncbi:MAG: alpha/beta hydrolase [Chloroflexota bacterium]|nr:alpha/beta hydrolase [Chloroflexota bacterium]
MDADNSYPSHLYRSAQGYAALMAWYAKALAALPVPYQTRLIDTPLARTHVVELGDPAAPPLVMLQGFGASSPLWKNQFPALAAHFHIYALDVPGHPGRSEARVLSLLDDSYARWLTGALDALGLERAPIVGVCLGGWIAMQTAITAPERVESLTMLSPVGLARFKIFVRSGVPVILNLGRAVEQPGERLLRMAFAPPRSGLTFDRDVARALMLVLKHYDVSAVAGFDGARPGLRDIGVGLRTLGRFTQPESDANLRRIAARTLLLVGEHEAIFSPRAAYERARRAIPNVDAEIVANVGHAAIYDRPDYVNERLLRFLHAKS